jgi:uncharacterized protein (TIGR01777 family)
MMNTTRRVIVTGATGMIGRMLCQKLIEREYQVVVFSRNPVAAQRSVPGANGYVAWAPGEPGAWATAIEGAYGVIHLAGASIAGQRWDTAYKQEILGSRVKGTRGIVSAMERARHRPEVLVCSSGVDYYGDTGDTAIDESAAPGRGFISQVCVAWEREAQRAETLGVRTSMMRTGIVLDKHDGALAKLLLPFQLGVGGPVLPGTQWWSWIHLDDVVGMLLLALENPQARGPFNTTAPEPERNRAFSTILGRVLGRPSLLPLPGFALELLLGEMAIPLLIEKQRALPKKALELGYQFAYPRLEPALRATLAG